MAADAVFKINESEKQGSEMIKSANETAKKIIRRAEMDAIQKHKEIIKEANRMREEMIDTASKKAEEDCAQLIQQGKKEKGRILNPDRSKLERATEIAIERIVNVNGNC